MTKIDWHPYPDEKPESEGWFLLTLKLGDLTHISIGLFFGKKFIGFEMGNLFRADDFLLAWSELPEPYRPELESQLPLPKGRGL